MIQIRLKRKEGARIRICVRWALILFLASSELLANAFGGHPVRTVGNLKAPPKSQEVLIYYASETAQEGPAADNSRHIAAWLASLSNSEARQESKSVLNDLTLFPTVVHRDIAALFAAATTRNMLIFSNETARSGTYLLGRTGQPLSRVPFSCRVAESRDPIRAASPLSSSECLAAALNEAAARFPVADYSFTILLNGHGYSERTLVPRICVRDTEISQEWLAKVFDGQAGDSSRQYRSRYGMSKPELLQVLATTVPGMSLGLVLLHSCHSAPPSKTEIPKNIAVLWTYGDEVKYDSVDYALVLTDAASGTVAEAMDAYLLHTQRAAARTILYNEAWAVMMKLIWFLPLILYVTWTAFRRKASGTRFFATASS